MAHAFRLALILLLVVLTLSVRAEESALFIALPPGAIPQDVSSSGTIVGALLSNGVSAGGFYWMPTTGVVYVGGTAAVAVSRNGETITGTAPDSRGAGQAALWQRAAEWRLLGGIASNALPCDSSLSSTFDTSDDGQVVVGLAWNGCAVARAFRWQESTGMVDLGTTVAGRSSRANGVSGDGKVVVGWQDAPLRQAARWVDGRQSLFTGPTGIVGEAHATNRDGSIIVGQTCGFASAADPTANQRAWTWTASDGVRCLEPPRFRPERNFIGAALAMSEDGRVIGGTQSFGLEAESVIWLDRQPFYLKDYLQSHGAANAFDRWVNTGFVTGVSRDGRILVGWGAGPTDFTGYIVILGSNGDR